jgi:RNA polymerase sigma factor (sigma-70 family)
MEGMTTMVADATLVRRLQQRDRVAWEELYAAYEPRLRRFALSLAGNGHDADDLVSEAFLRVLPALDRLDAAEVNLEAYLFATTRNLFLKQVGRAKRTEPVADVPEPVTPVPIEDDPERSALLGAQQTEVRMANASLQPRQRMVLALCELEERSYAEIGEIVGLNENAVAQLVYRARESLRTELRLLQVDPGSLPEECRAFLPALSQHLDGQLREPRKSATLAHLEGCERCQAALTDMREAQKRYRTVFLPLGVPTDGVRARIERGLDEEGYWGGRAVGGAGRRGMGAKIAAVIGGAVLCLAGGLGLASVLADDSTSASGATTAGRTTAATLRPETRTEGTTDATTSEASTTTTTSAVTTATEPTTTATTSTVTTSPATLPATTASAATTAAVTQPAATTAPAPVEDVTAPVVTFSKTPPPTTAETSAGLAFTSSEKGTTFTCRVDNGAWKACASPMSVNGLAIAAHTFSVRAKDAAGNVGSATASWKVVPPPDTTPPTVTFTSAPADGSSSTSASFAFSGSEPGLSFTCALDGGAFAVCASPSTQNALTVGDHVFVVRGTDQAGNVGEASHAWTIAAPPLPDLVVSALSNRGVTVKNVGNAPSGQTTLVVSGSGTLTFTLSGLTPGQTVSFTWSCKAGTLVAVVDPGNQVTESSESNNTLAKTTGCLGLGT